MLVMTLVEPVTYILRPYPQRFERQLTLVFKFGFGVFDSILYGGVLIGLVTFGHVERVALVVTFIAGNNPPVAESVGEFREFDGPHVGFT